MKNLADTFFILTVVLGAMVWHHAETIERLDKIESYLKMMCGLSP